MGVHNQALNVDLAGRVPVRDRSHDVPVGLGDVPDEPRRHKLISCLDELRDAVVADYLGLDQVGGPLQIGQVVRPTGDLSRCQPANCMFRIGHAS